jgi:hypothetical protein
MHPWVWGRMRLYGVQGTQSVRADDEPETRPIIGEEGSTLRLTTTERRLKPRTSPESQPRLGFTGASKNSAHRVFFSRVLLQQAAELQTSAPPHDLLQGRELHPGCRRLTHRGASDRTNPYMACAISAITRSQAYLAVVADAEDRHGRRPHSSCTGSVRPAPKPVSGGSIYTRPVDGVRHAIRFAAGCSGSLHLRLERSCIVVPDPPKLAAQLPDAPLMGSIRRRRQYSRISRPPAMAAGLLGWLAAGLLF